MTNNWSFNEVPDLAAWTIVVTGANSGIGYEAAKELAKKNAEVILACRNQEKATEAAETIKAEAPDAKLVLIPLDLADLDSVRSFSRVLHERYDRLSALINNAGVMALPKRSTRDGFEMQFGTNHLGHFALTGLLLDLLAKTPDSRVVTVSSFMHKYGRIRFHDPNWQNTYHKWGAYSQSKLANLLFTHELDRLLKKNAESTISVACHPGWAATNLLETGPKMEGARTLELLTAWANAMLAQPAADGAMPTLYATLAPLEGNEYVGPDGFRGWRGRPKVVEPLAKARDDEAARRLWELSEELTGIRYPLHG